MKMRWNNNKPHYALTALTIAAALLLTKCKKDDPISGWSYYRENVDPPKIESMTSVVKNCVPPYPVTFNQECSHLLGTVKYQWDFGDGTQSTDMNPQHVYNTPGNYLAKLVVSNEIGADTAYIDLTDLQQSSIPIKPVFTYDHYNNNNFAPAKIIFNNTSTGANQFYWYFGDGTESNSDKPEHIFSAQGNYSVKMRGICTDGSFEETTQQIFINPAPTMVFVDSINIMLPSSANNTPVFVELWHNTTFMGRTVTRSGSFPFKFKRPADFPGGYFFDNVQFSSNEVFKFLIIKDGASPVVLHEITLAPSDIQNKFYPLKYYKLETVPAIEDVFIDLYLKY
jgi:PKD repeat protein